MRWLGLLLVASSLSQPLNLTTPNSKCTNAIPNARMPPGFCAEVWKSGAGKPRGVHVADNNDVLVTNTNAAAIVAHWDANNDGVADGSATIATAPGLNHAVMVNGAYLYASSQSTVFRWRYTAGNRTNLGSYEVVVKGIPTDHHVTRVLIFDREGRLYVHCGSEANVAPNDLHSRIHRFVLPAVIPSGGLDWTLDGEYFAGGLRNENGLRFDDEDRLWGVENGRDELNRADLGGDIHTDNPGEEINMFDKNQPGRYYGYPRCWSVGTLTVQGTRIPPGTQYADPTFMPATTDDWCRNTSNVVPPSRLLYAHTAPLDIIFWPKADNTSWPLLYRGSAFVALHGSWNRDPKSGYLVEFVKFEDGTPVANAPFFGYPGAPYNPPASNWFRPVAMGRIKCKWGDCMVVSSDTTGQLIIISYRPDETTPTDPPTPNPTVLPTPAPTSIAVSTAPTLNPTAPNTTNTAPATSTATLSTLIISFAFLLVCSITVQ